MPKMIDLTAGAPANAGQDRFSSLEWLVIALGARNESVALPWSPFGRSLMALAAVEPALLGRPCLELLRSTARVASRCGWAMPPADMGVFLHGGWSEDQLEQLIESVGPETPDAQGQLSDLIVGQMSSCTPVFQSGMLAAM
jgi:hypothetical protein